ncbi:MAG: 2Fe-2S iron-sulfur cluster-binding protein, partial [Gemmataceae bacterium]
MAKTSLAVLNLPIPGGREEEGLFARDEDDALVRREKKTQDDFKEQVSITIDGRTLKVPKAVPVTDAQGNPKIGPDGKPIPRATTIYDAAAQVFDREELNRRIPVLCHQEHVTPVAVCRMCSVHASRRRKRDGKLAPGEKLLPACQHEVQDGMIVTTRGCDPEGIDAPYFQPDVKKVTNPEEITKLTNEKAKERLDSKDYALKTDKAVKCLTELLFADHLHPDPTRDDRYRNELVRVGENVGVKAPREGLNRSSGRNEGKHPKSRPLALPIADDTDTKFPYSARTIAVDHDRCILCDRCVRACSEVKPFQVIGHTGKG